MTHDELVEHAAIWLRTRTPSAVVITEMVTGHETPDAIGFAASGLTWLIECKATRADFQRDRHKTARLVGGMGDYRYYLTPPGLIAIDEIPSKWGLIEVHPKQYRRELVATDLARPDKAWRQELGLLISALRRVGQDPPPGISVKAYRIETERRATLGVKPHEDAN